MEHCVDDSAKTIETLSVALYRRPLDHEIALTAVDKRGLNWSGTGI